MAEASSAEPGSRCPAPPTEAGLKGPRSPGRITPAFGFAYVERALLEGIGRRKFGVAEMAEVAAFFGEPLRCVYCDSAEVVRWDHLVPVIAGGETVLGNMVPSCASCDDAKSKSDFATWLRGRAERGQLGRDSADQRIERLGEYMQRFGYAPMVLSSRLGPDDAARLAELRSRLAALRRDVEGFLARIRSP